ncbi:MAG: Ig-like domain-containing protein, partial [Anaerolineae bacterium]|nr:Ig-like domain-containing protein [Anaerolineae bacterium]
MTLYRRSTLIRLGVVLAVLLLVISACGGDEDKDAEKAPTVPATVTPPPTRTQIGFQPSPTAFPTWTPYQSVLLPTATQLVLLPTATPFATWTSAAPTATAYPYDVRITYPVDGSEIAGYVTVVGSASHARFVQYALEWGPDPNPNNLWYPFLAPPQRTNIVVSGSLGAWNTTLVSDGIYQIRVHVWLDDGTDIWDVVTGIRVSNTRPTAVPTATNTPRPNQLPVINPIPSQQITTGQTATVRVTTSDPDGDAVNLFVASSDPAVALVQFSDARNEIAVTGMAAGTATITVTANDNHGGSVNAAFVVTVQGQNAAPKVDPIPNQSLEVGRMLDLEVKATDPDGDPLTIDVSSDNQAVVSVNKIRQDAMRIQGVAQGAATISVTVNDGKGGVVNIAFQVSVGVANQPPTLDAIPAQTMDVGDTLDVPYRAFDPDGDTLAATAVSDNLGVASANVSRQGTVSLVAIGSGSATITLTVNDGLHPDVSVKFPVSVGMGNQPPKVDLIPGQSLMAGGTLDVPYNATDPDGDLLTALAMSSDVNVVTANVSAPGMIALIGNNAGTATVTLTVNDGVHPDVSVPFQVTVAVGNQPPVVDAIGPQSLAAGGTLDVPYNATDPDGDLLTALAVSSDETVVTASVNVPAMIALIGNNAGTATVTLTVNDGVHPDVSVPFQVTVAVGNQPPVVDAIGPQSLAAGGTLDVPYNATDPDGDLL